MKGCAKQTPQQTASNDTSRSIVKDTNQRVIPPLGFGAFKNDTDNKAAASAKPQQISVAGPGNYTKEEIDVLRRVIFMSQKCLLYLFYVIH